MTSSVASLLEPSYHTTPPREYTLGPLVAELMAGCSDDKGPYVMDPEQRMLLDDWFGYTADDKLASFEATVVDCRQNKKTGTLKAAALGKLFVCEQRLVVWTAHLTFATDEAMRDLQRLIESNPDMDREVVRVRERDKMIELTGDRRLLFKARHSSSGRSLSGDTVILDEGFYLDPGDMGALLPTLNARPDPQVLVGSSAGLKRSAVLRAIRDRGRMGVRRTSYAEWQATPTECAEDDCSHVFGKVEGCALDREDLMVEANTAITRGRINLDTVKSLRQSLPPEEFSRECFGWWDDPVAEGEAAAIPSEVWNAPPLLDEDSRPGAEVVFGLDVSPRRSWAGVVAASLNASGRVHLEVPASRGDVLYQKGTQWVVGAFRKLAKRHAGAKVRMLAKSQAAAYAKAIGELGFEVEQVAPGDYPQLCTDFVESALAGELAHLGDVSLAAHVASGVLVDIGEEQARWGRRVSSSDICLLVASTLARDAVVNGSSSFNVW